MSSIVVQFLSLKLFLSRTCSGPSTEWAGGCGTGSRFDAVKMPDPRSGHIGQAVAQSKPGKVPDLMAYMTIIA